MFRWCAYCWSFLGEREPLVDLSSTHGICERCVDSEAHADIGIIERTRPIKEFHRRLTDIATANSADEVEEVLSHGLQLGLGPIEMLVGVIQPALYQVGHLWQNGAITIADEARLTRFCDRVLDALYAQQRTRAVRPIGAPVFLLRANGNSHDLGLKMLAFALREARRDVRFFPNPPSVENLCGLCVMLRPAALGISVSLESQVGYVFELMRALEARGLRPRVVVGGRAVLDNVALPPAATRWTALDSLRSAPALFADPE